MKLWNHLDQSKKRFLTLNKTGNIKNFGEIIQTKMNFFSTTNFLRLCNIETLKSIWFTLIIIRKIKILLKKRLNSNSRFKNQLKIKI